MSHYFDYDVIRARDTDGNDISCEQFFERYPEFYADYNATENAERVLRMLLRHPEDMQYFTDIYGTVRSFTVYGMHIYSVIFMRENHAIILMDIRIVD